MEDKKMEIPKVLPNIVNEERINKVLKQVNETEQDTNHSMEVSRQLLDLMRGKTLEDLSCGILTLIQLAPIPQLFALRHIFDELLKTATGSLLSIMEK